MLVRIDETRETNSFYDAGKSSNGGGYHQPIYEGVIIDGTKEYPFELHDASCGDFGSRYMLSVSVDGKSISATFGSMFRNYFEGSSFDKENELHVLMVLALNKEFDIDIPYYQDIWDDE